jgi:hypothetical protein
VPSRPAEVAGQEAHGGTARGPDPCNISWAVLSATKVRATVWIESICLGERVVLLILRSKKHLSDAGRNIRSASVSTNNIHGATKRRGRWYQPKSSTGELWCSTTTGDWDTGRNYITPLNTSCFFSCCCMMCSSAVFSDLIEYSLRRVKLRNFY